MNNPTSLTREQNLHNWSQIISECQEAKARGTKVRDWLETRGISHDTYYVTALFRGIKKPQLSL